MFLTGKNVDRKRFERGEGMINTTRFMGYDKDETGDLVINKKEAKIVRRIFEMYLSGEGCHRIAKILNDEGIKTITGSTWHPSTIKGKKRDDFNRMIADCRAGKIDLIITKSISRFARNTLDCLNYVRELKDLEIGIVFEKENINTLDAKGEVLLTILSSLAQDESRSISENST